MEIRLIFLCSLLVPFLSFLGLDTTLSENLYTSTKGWACGDRFIWKMLYEYGAIPAYVSAFLSLLLLVASYAKKNFAHYRRLSLYILLVLLIGPGLIVNVLLKDHWGRPRPRQVNLFGGSMSYQYVWQPGEIGNGKSFPCGHAAAGFFLIAPYFVLRRGHRRLAWMFLVFGIFYGSLMGIARMAQGGHFLSDVIGSGVIVYAVALTLSGLFGFGRDTACDTLTADIPLLADGEARG
jgi:lipid A 4'-phosphatase